ncbi:MAG: DNA polymerase domain-containing protein [Chloroflexota bacterium]
MTATTREVRGWLLDLYADPAGGIALWVIGEDGQRHRLRQELPATFYAAGPAQVLRQLWRWLEGQPVPLCLSRTERRDLFSGGTIVLAVEVRNPADQPPLFARAARQFPELAYYDTDIPLALRHAARYDSFPLARCRLDVDAAGRVQALDVLDSRWQLDLPLPPVRTLAIEPDTNPTHAAPRRVIVRSQRGCCTLDLEPGRALLVGLRSLFRQYDPDLLLTAWGDTWLLPHLLGCARQAGLDLPLNRDPGQAVLHKDERTYFAYGQVIYRGQQMHLFGRWHIDINNAVMYHDYGLEGVWELARVTSLPVQTVARVSPGTGISSMQILTALRQGVLVPWHKQQAERPKTTLDLLRADMGGLVFQPIIGLHRDVAEVDFVSMYPSIMACFNISPETVIPGRRDPATGLPVTALDPGLVPQTLQPLLDKRLALKAELAGMPKWDPRRKRYKACASAHKWLLVTCFGYLGYKNARFGRIEAHEAVTAYGREALLRAKDAAEDLGFHVLHLYVDGMWVHKPGCATVRDFQPLLDAILERTCLPIALDGVYRWVAFLPSRLDGRVPVANRYFGVFQDGSVKARGIELRRRDTPLFIADLQQRMLEVMARAPDAAALPEQLPELYALIRRSLADLRAGRVRLDRMLVTQRLSRMLEEYRTPSLAARAVGQLAAAGKSMRPGQHVRFVHTLGEPGVHAWDLPAHLDSRQVDTGRYAELLLRAAETILTPLGISRQWLDEQVLDGVRSYPLPVVGESLAVLAVEPTPGKEKSLAGPRACGAERDQRGVQRLS